MTDYHPLMQEIMESIDHNNINMQLSNVSTKYPHRVASRRALVAPTVAIVRDRSKIVQPDKPMSG